MSSKEVLPASARAPVVESTYYTQQLLQALTNVNVTGLTSGPLFNLLNQSCVHNRMFS